MTRCLLPNGDSLYVGRGQQQIFGYGALVYLLEAAAGLTGEEQFGAIAERAFSRLMRFQRSDGSFPLVLREGEPAEPWLPDISRPGWYTYNRYADYLPLLGCFLLKAADPEVPPFGAVAPVSAHPAFRLWREDRYVAVLALPGGASTNDLAFPYVCLEGQSLFPCYGAEGATAPEAENIAMNKLVRNSVDKPISRKSLLSSLIVYIVRAGLIKNRNKAAIIIMK